MTTATRFSWRDFWGLTRGYWFSEEKWSARGLLAIVVALNLGQVYLSVIFNEWYNLFYNSLQELDEKAFWHQLFRFSWIAALFIIAGVYSTYLNQMLQIRWRRWLTERYLDHWLEHRVYYRLQLTDGGTDNPDQRIAQDLQLFVLQTLSLSLGLLSSVVTLASFLTILWNLSGPLSFTLAGHEIAIPGYMLWAAIVYAIAGTWLINKVGRPLFGLNFNQQRFEADFRYALVRLRENSEAVALYGGEAREHDTFRARFANIFANWWALMRRQKTLGWFSSGYGQLAIIFPFVVAAPRYFAKSIQLGGLMQISSAFGQVQTALSFIVNSYTDIAQWRSVVDRLVTFQQSVERVSAATEKNAITHEPAAAMSLEVSDLDLQMPDGKAMINHAAFTVQPGESVLIAGRSGTGKSTLFRAIAGIWPFGQGRVRVPADAKVLFLPQRPYMPLGTLAACLSYPEPVGDTDDAAKRRALIDCGLEQFAERLQEEQNWGQALSPGEQQRVAFARILLKRPDWVFMDEATSALDEPLEQALYAKLRERLPKLTMVSIGHRPGVAAYHERRLTLEAGEGGARLVAATPVAAAE
jgi:vitamin B12/bleomycin/antimicrobial peptide transport system ATP-binding/permease protein